MPASNPAWECSLNERGMPHARLEYRNETDSAEVERSNGAKYSAKRVHRPETAARSARRRPHPVRWNWVRGWGDPLLGGCPGHAPGGSQVPCRRGSPRVWRPVSLPCGPAPWDRQWNPTEPPRSVVRGWGVRPPPTLFSCCWAPVEGTFVGGKRRGARNRPAWSRGSGVRGNAWPPRTNPLLQMGALNAVRWLRVLVGPVPSPSCLPSGGPALAGRPAVDTRAAVVLTDHSPPSSGVRAEGSASCPS